MIILLFMTTLCAVGTSPLTSDFKVSLSDEQNQLQKDEVATKLEETMNDFIKAPESSGGLFGIIFSFIKRMLHIPENMTTFDIIKKVIFSLFDIGAKLIISKVFPSQAKSDEKSLDTNAQSQLSSRMNLNSHSDSQPFTKQSALDLSKAELKQDDIIEERKQKVKELDSNIEKLARKASKISRLVGKMEKLASTHESEE